MAGVYWSLRNKLEDVERALTQGQNASARMAGHELGIRLSHLTNVLQLQTEGAALATPTKQDDWSFQEAHTRFEDMLDLLLSLLKDKQHSRAVEVVQQMCELLDVLDRSSMPKPSAGIHSTDQP